MAFVAVSVNVICLSPGRMFVPATKLPDMVPVLLDIGVPTIYAIESLPESIITVTCVLGVKLDPL